MVHTLSVRPVSVVDLITNLITLLQDSQKYKDRVLIDNS